MQTYILREPNSVEPQKTQFVESIEPQNLPHPETPTSLDYVSSRGSSPNEPSSGRALFIGLDVHNDSIAVSLAPSDSTEVRRYGIIGGSHDDVLKLAKRLQGIHPGNAKRAIWSGGVNSCPSAPADRSHDILTDYPQ